MTAFVSSTAVLILLCSEAFAQVRVPTAPRPTNLNFKRGELGQVPSGWSLPKSAAKAGYVAELTSDGPDRAHRAALLRSPASINPSTFGDLMQTVDAAAYRGKLIRFAATVRTGELRGDSRAGLWVRIDRQGSQSAVFDNMADQPIKTTEWKAYNIVMEVPEDADAISFGVLLVGMGNVWIGPASFEVAELPQRERPHPLRGYALQSVIAFVRLAGYVRYFHPSDQAQSLDWERFAIEGIRRVERARNPAQLASCLKQLFAPIAPTLALYLSQQEPPPQQFTNRVYNSELAILKWHHRGLNSESDPGSIYKSVRIKQPVSGSPESLLELPYQVELSGGVSARIPLTLLADKEGTLPHGQRIRVISPGNWTGTYFSARDRATRLADVGLFWNIPQHFYPYFDLEGTDWRAALAVALSAAAVNIDEIQFLDTLRQLAAALRDGHAQVSSLGDPRKFRPPLTWDWIENQLVVTHLDKETKEVRVGDVIRTIDGRPAEDVISDASRFISGATPRFIRSRAVLLTSAGVKDSRILLGVESASEFTHTISLTREVSLLPFTLENRPDKIHEVRPGIFYVDLERVSESEFRAALPQLSSARGIVFDVRGYPFGVRPVLQHLISEPISSPQWLTPLIERPDRVDMKFELSQWTVQPEKPHLKAKTVFLADARAMSRPETMLAMVEHYKLGPIVGSASAGTNGDTISIKLPGNYRAYMTGMKVLKEDGSQHHGVGIRPTIPVARSVKGVIEGRDEILEQGIEEAARGNAPAKFLPADAGAAADLFRSALPAAAWESDLLRLSPATFSPQMATP